MAVPKKSPTMIEVGRMVGCHPSTVSLALRSDPRIPPETQQRVKAAAEKLGYQVHPMIAAWVSARRAGRPVERRGAAIFLTCLPGDSHWKADRHFRSIFEGAREQAERYGFSLAEMRVADYSRDMARLNEVLITRNVQGLIIGPAREHHELTGIEWSRFALVTIGYGLHSPSLHRVSEDHHLGMRLAFEFCLANGYRRIGMALVRKHNAMRRERWIGAFLYEQFQNLKPADRVPLFEVPSNSPLSVAGPWLKKNRPDILLVDDPSAWRGSTVPTLGFALSSGHEFSGVRENNQGVGRQAADMLFSLILRNERGLPAMRQTLLVEPSLAETVNAMARG